jgi:hypothetical protein
MVGIALEYLAKMGYQNTQFIIARHHDTDHPYIHLVINRIDNEGKRISDRNERFRNTKVCMEPTRKYGLYIAKGKENVKRHRLKEPDRTKYGIYDAIKASLPKCRNWQELTAELKRQGITIDFRKNGSMDKIQGIRFGKGNYTFNGSQIDRSCSYSMIDFQLKQNSWEQEISLQPPKLFQVEQDHNGHDLAVRHGKPALSVPFAVIFRQEVSLRYFVEFPAEFVRHEVYFYYICIHKR